MFNFLEFHRLDEQSELDGTSYISEWGPEQSQYIGFYANFLLPQTKQNICSQSDSGRFADFVLALEAGKM